MAVSISQLWFEHHRTALGIGEAKPRISWRFEGTASNWEQSSYDIEIKRGGDVQTHTAQSSESLYVEWPETALDSKEAATVRARAHGGHDQQSTPWSDWVAVETGLLEEKDWGRAVPIAADRDTEEDGPKRPIYFRKSFSLDEGAVESARLYITALGLYEAEINGDRVGDAVLAPGWQSYNHRHVYNTYDVTKLLKKGDNAIGVVVGEGWYAGRIGFDLYRNVWGDTIGPLALLRATLKDGSTVEVQTDTTWSANTGPMNGSEIYDGETYDSRFDTDIEGWSSPGFNDTAWLETKELPAPKGTLMSPDAPPNTKQIQIKPQEFFKSPSGKQLVDFGQNLVGWLKLSVKGPRGTNITIQHAEVLSEGELDLVPLRTAKATDTLILHGDGRQTREPHFTYHGFRYAQIDGWPDETPLDADAIAAQVMFSDMEETGSFECSHTMLNKFHENVRWSMRGNFLTIPTDCPQRDERLGWTGDAHNFNPTSNFLYYSAGFWRGWHRDMWSEMQTGGSMAVPYYVPTLPADTQGAPAAVWGDVAVANPRNSYQAFGDKVLLEEQFDQAEAWISTGIPRSSDNLWDPAIYQFGDWLDPKSPPEDPGAATTHAVLVADAYLVGMTQYLVDMAHVLGNDSVATKYSDQVTQIREQFQKTWMKDGKPLNETQTAYALALTYDLYTDADERKAAGKALQDIISNNSYLVGTYFAGTPALGPALEAAGGPEYFYAMLLQTSVPSWLYQVTMNGTTTWERWDSMLANGTVNTGTMTSFNHYAFGSVADWIHGVIGGIRPGAPGYKVVEVKPIPAEGITSAKTGLLSGYGQIAVSWELAGSKFSMEVTVPPNAKANVTLPGETKSKLVGSGKHTFSNMYKALSVGNVG